MRKVLFIVVFIAVAAVVVVVAVWISEKFVYYEGDDRGDPA